ncbi:MAG: AAA family ATPase [Candidatus Woesearchaeota archaeon]
MGLFDDMLSHSGTVVKNESALEYEYVPKLLPFRENEQKHIADCIKPLFMKRTARNLFIYGGPGIGKTCSVKYVLRELEEKDEDEGIFIFYVNCWQKNSTFKVLMELCDIVGYKFTQNKKTVELFKIAAQIINKKSAVFVFDEIDKAEDFDFLYFILEEIYKKSIILITNYKSWLAELEDRVKSRLLAEISEFTEYSLAETEGILRERVKEAFFDDVWSKECFNVVFHKAFEMKDIRSGIFLLKESSLIADERGSKKVSLDDVNKALKKLEDFTIKNSADLEEDTQFILDIVRENTGRKIGELYEVYKQKGGKAVYKTFQRKIAMLEKNRFISTERLTGAGGNTTIISKVSKTNKSLDEF